MTSNHPQREDVALRKESVDRNLLMCIIKQTPLVALRKESVDRNRQPAPSRNDKNVALRKESVDRNVKRLKTP